MQGPCRSGPMARPTIRAFAFSSDMAAGPRSGKPSAGCSVHRPTSKQFSLFAEVLYNRFGFAFGLALALSSHTLQFTDRFLFVRKAAHDRGSDNLSHATSSNWLR